MSRFLRISNDYTYFIRKMYLKSFVVVFFMSCLSYCQTKGISFYENNEAITPKVIKYTRNDFKADPQFWTMCETNDKSLIFGNNDGALVFDGEHWQKVYLPNNSSVRSIVKTSSGKIYVGGYNELGTLQKNKFGNYFYKSLVAEFHLEDKNIENLWQVHQYDKFIIYRSFLELIVINGSRVTQLPSNKSFLYSANVRGNYYVQDSEYGVYKLNSKSVSLELVFDNSIFPLDELASILPTKDPNIILLTSKSGFVYTGDISKKVIIDKKYLFSGVKSDQISTGICLDNYDYLFGTLSSRIIKLNNSGVISRDNETSAGLSYASIHCLFQTENKNIWVLQNNGLSFLDFKSPFISVFDGASVYDILVKGNTVYVATNNGVFYSNFSSLNNNFNFVKVEGLQGQSWAIQDIDNEILISHDTGIYKLENGKVQKVGTQTGFWKITKIKEKSNLFLASNYNGLYLVEKLGKNWIIKNKIKGFDESSRDILADYEPNTYWICHGYKGVYKVHLNADYSRIDAVDHFTNKNGFKSPYNINVFNWKGKIVFTTNTGIYTYNNQTNKFEPYSALNKLFDITKNTRKILEANSKTWFIQDDEAGYFYSNIENPKLNKDLFLNLKGSFNRGMESIYPINNNKVFFGTNSGLYLYTIFNTKAKDKFPTIISQVNYTHNQELKLIEIDSEKNQITLPNQTDILRFEFSSPKMISSTEINYSYKLENVDENWSPWQKNAYKEYTHLRPGNYTFIVKSRNLAGLIGEETSFQFTILPKWYQTNLAYFIYLLAGISFIYFLSRYVSKKIAFERLKSKIEVKKTQQLLELEIEKLKLKHDKEEIYKDKLTLEEDIIGKSKELANYTLLLSQKKNAFNDLQNDLKQLRELLKSEESRRKITEIFQKLNQHKIGEEYMEIFDVNFEKIHHDFFEKLKQLDPTITKRELRLCAFVKMDLTNKEISPLLNISTRGVETARYKVRKKLNVSHEENFTAFLEKIATTSN